MLNDSCSANSNRDLAEVSQQKPASRQDVQHVVIEWLIVCGGDWKAKAICQVQVNSTDRDSTSEPYFYQPFCLYCALVERFSHQIPVQQVAECT